MAIKKSIPYKGTNLEHHRIQFIPPINNKSGEESVGVCVDSFVNKESIPLGNLMTTSYNVMLTAEQKAQIKSLVLSFLYNNLNNEEMFSGGVEE